MKHRAVFLFLISAWTAAAGPSPAAGRASTADKAEFQFKIGLGHYTGSTGTRDLTEASAWFTKAAEAGHPRAQGMLGLCYHAGRGVTRDYRKAADWLNKAATQEDPIAQFSLGTMHANGNGLARDPAKAAHWYRKAAEQGHAAAQTNLGVALETGQGVTKNFTAAAEWYRKAAAQNFAVAQVNLGLLHANGRGMPRNKTAAVECYKKAAANGNITSQFLLGYCFYQGEGAPKDFIQAYKWMNLAAAQGHPSAPRHRMTIGGKMTVKQVAEAQKLTTLHLTKNKPQSVSGKTYATHSSPTSAKQDIASGTGFFITADGFLLTNQHVVAGATRVEVHTPKGSVPARIVKSDAANDIALLKVPGEYNPLPLGTSRSVKLGHPVFTIGFPNTAVQGVEPKYTNGRISGLSGLQDDPRQFQVSVAVQPGNSGGALVDDRGNVIGMITFRLDDLKTFRLTGVLPQNVNYALKSVFLSATLESLPEIPEKLAPPVQADRKYEDVVKDAQEAAVLILVYR